MVSTRNQATNAPNAEPLVSIPTIYRPSTPGGRPIIQAVPGTRAQLSNGGELRFTRSGIYLAPIPTGNWLTTSATRTAPEAVALSREDSPFEDSTSQHGAISQLSQPISGNIEPMSSEATGLGNMSTGSINMEPGNVAEKLGAAAGQGTKRNIGGDIELPQTEKKIKLEQSLSPPLFGADIMPYVDEDPFKGK